MGTTTADPASAAAQIAYAISFDEIPQDFRSPGTNIEVRPNYTNKGLAAFPSRAIVLGQPLPGVPAPVLGKPVQITRTGQAAALWGAGSPIAQAVEAFIAANATTSLWAMASLPPPPGSAAAVGGVQVGGAPTGAGALAQYVGGLRAAQPVSAGDTPAEIAAGLAGAINAVASMPVTAAVDATTASKVVLTAKYPGALGNDLDLRNLLQVDDAIPPGLTLAVTAMAGGVGTPDIGALLATIGNQWFTDIACVFRDGANLAALAAELDRRYGAMGKLDAHAYVGIPGGYSALAALSPTLQNSRFLSAIGLPRVPSPPWVAAGSLAGVASLALANDPSRQMRGLVLPGVVAPDDDDAFVEEEKDQLLRLGFSTFSVVFGQMALDRVITGNLVNSLGAPDTAWLDIMTPKTCSRIRWDWRQYAQTVWPRCKLAPDGSAAEIYDADGVVVTPRRAWNAWGARCKLYARAGWIVNESATIAASRFQIDPADANKLLAIQQVQLVGNLMILDGALEFAA